MCPFQIAILRYLIRFLSLLGAASKPSENYIPPEILDETLFEGGISTGINFDKYEKVNVKVDGSDPPQAIDNFDQCGFRGLVAKNLQRAGYANPTPVQKHAIPIGKNQYFHYTYPLA